MVDEAPDDIFAEFRGNASIDVDRDLFHRARRVIAKGEDLRVHGFLAFDEKMRDLGGRGIFDPGGTEVRKGDPNIRAGRVEEGGKGFPCSAILVEDLLESRTLAFHHLESHENAGDDGVAMRDIDAREVQFVC